MKPISSSTQGLELNTDRISAASKQRIPKAEQTAKQEEATFVSSAFRREVPFSKNSEFVEVDGKKYFLSAPRGSYLNILV